MGDDLDRVPWALALSSDLRELSEAAHRRAAALPAQFFLIFFRSPLGYATLWFPVAVIILCGGTAHAQAVAGVMICILPFVSWSFLGYRILFLRAIFPLVTVLALWIVWLSLLPIPMFEGFVPRVADAALSLLFLGSLPAVLIMYVRWRREIAERVHAYDKEALVMLRLVKAMHDGRELWWQRRTVRQWSNSLEVAAVETARAGCNKRTMSTSS
ncbi:hypothetical protein [Streptomyces sp. PsTaAH-124]|uniref:hypothetical protein n=1 Tax=Streptomyces sp. PsTaAH-124 TaxID=1157638 RepID=UPI0003752590|nr:hypothetical protein [Streptomyces sp. PsTaAH-124]